MKLTRRNFIKSSGCATAATAINQSLVPRASADQGSYKALVCVFLYGGNDAYNMFVPYPYDSQSGGTGSYTEAYHQYKKIRPQLGLNPGDILDTGLNCDNSVRIGVNSSMQKLNPLFQDGRAVPIINSGTLIKPTVRSDIGTPGAELPDFLMAHNLQQDMWKSGNAELDNLHGWGGRLLQAMGIQSNDVMPLFTLDGNSKWLRHPKRSQVGLKANGLDKYYYPNSTVTGGIDGVYKWHAVQDYDNVYQKQYAELMLDAYDEHSILYSALNTHQKSLDYGDDDLSKQLQVAGQLIRARQDLGHQRQLILVGMGGFDTHQNQSSQHNTLLSQVADALTSFQQELEEQGLSDQVTTFTMSDFGRRIPANGTGTDHGWGGHQIIMGGAVKGGRAYGSWPDLRSGSESDYGNGRMIPGISSDQVNATLAHWYGLPEQQLPELFSTLKNFPGQETLNFL